MSTPEPPNGPDRPAPGTEPTERVDTLASPGAGGARPWWRGAGTAGIVVVALGLAGLTGVALARGGDGGGTEQALAAATGTPAPSGDAKGDRWRGPHRLGGGLMGLAGAVRGELVVPDGSGGYRTVLMQRGEATAVGSDTITVKSDDGFTETYDVPAGTRVGALREGLSSVDVGDQVVVMADKGSGNPTARTLLDLDSIGRGMGGLLHGPGGMGGWMHGPDDDDVPAPGSTTGTEGSAYGA